MVVFCFKAPKGTSLYLAQEAKQSMRLLLRLCTKRNRFVVLVVIQSFACTYCSMYAVLL